MAIVAAVDCRNGTENADVNGMLQAKDNGGVSLNYNNVVRTQTFVAGFSPNQSAEARSLGYQEECSPTIRGGQGGNQKPAILRSEAQDGEPRGADF